jgi:hypothetical protein
MVVKRLLSQMLLFEIRCFKTSTKLIILKGFFANDAGNKVVQNLKNKIIKTNSTLKLILND